MSECLTRSTLPDPEQVDFAGTGPTTGLLEKKEHCLCYEALVEFIQRHQARKVRATPFEPSGGKNST